MIIYAFNCAVEIINFSAINVNYGHGMHIDEWLNDCIVFVVIE